jgi:hypothetical protein
MSAATRKLTTPQASTLGPNLTASRGEHWIRWDQFYRRIRVESRVELMREGNRRMMIERWESSGRRQIFLLYSSSKAFGTSKAKNLKQ